MEKNPINNPKMSLHFLHAQNNLFFLLLILGKICKYVKYITFLDWFCVVHVCMRRSCMHIISTGFGAAFCGLVFHSSVKSLALSQFLPHTHTCLSPSMLPRVTVEKHTQTSCREKQGGGSEHTMQCSTSHYDTTQRTCTH